MEIYQLNETGFWSDFSTSEYLTNQSFPLMSFNEIASKLGLSTVKFILLHVFFFLVSIQKRLITTYILSLNNCHIGATAAPFVIV